MAKESLLSAVAASLDRGIDFLADQQAPDGVFVTQASDALDLHDPTDISTVYSQTYILHALLSARDVEPVAAVLAKGAEWLKSQQEPNGTWRFFGHSNEMPPPDWDDTCCALAFLIQHGDSVQDVSPLLAEQRTDRGLYYTWLTASYNENTFYPIDGAVNTNILLYLGLCGRPEDALVDYLNWYAALGKYINLSLYAVSEFSVCYIISRTYRHGGVRGLAPAMSQIVRHLMSKRNSKGTWERHCDTALALAALLNAGYFSDELQAAVRWLAQRQDETGAWRGDAFFQDFTPTYYGSETLTTAFAVEALAKFRRAAHA